MHGMIPVGEYTSGWFHGPKWVTSKVGKKSGGTFDYDFRSQNDPPGNFLEATFCNDFHWENDPLGCFFIFDLTGWFSLAWLSAMVRKRLVSRVGECGIGMSGLDW